MKTLNISNDLGIQRYVLTWSWIPHRALPQEILWTVCTILEARGEDILTNATNRLVIKGTRYCTTNEIREIAAEATGALVGWSRAERNLCRFDLIIKSRNLSSKNDVMIKCQHGTRKLGLACPKMFRNDPKLSLLAHRMNQPFVSDNEIVYADEIVYTER